MAHFIAEAQSDPDLAVAWRERFVNRIRKERRPIIERAIARGEIPAGSDPELIMDLLFGPLYHRYLNRHLPLNESFARGVARMVAAGAVNGTQTPLARAAGAISKSHPHRRSARRVGEQSVGPILIAALRTGSRKQ